MTNKKRNTGCPIAYALDIFGDRWSLVIIRDILFKGVETYSELLKADERIATNVLANRLKEFEVSGIISKKQDPDNKRQYIYKITKKGAELVPILLEMVLWSAKYDSNTIATKEVLGRIKKDREKFIKEIKIKALK